MYINYQLECKLYNYLKKNPKVILDSLDNSHINYDKDNWELYKVEIEDDKSFICYVSLFPGWLPAISTLEIPTEFIRKEKLQKISI